VWSVVRGAFLPWAVTSSGNIFKWLMLLGLRGIGSFGWGRSCEGLVYIWAMEIRSRVHFFDRGPPDEVDAAPVIVSDDVVLFARERLGFVADCEQERVLLASGKRVVLNCCRQWGKSTVTAAKAVHHAASGADRLVLVACPCERQSSEFIRKVKGFLRRLGMKARGETGHPLSAVLENGSRIIGLPGSEDTVRGFSSVSLLIVDEAARVPDAVYEALTPSTAVVDGAVWLLSTPAGRRGFFFDAWEYGGPGWERISVPATKCSRISSEFLERERAGMTERRFAQEYLCKFEDGSEGALDPESVRRAFSRDVEILKVP